ncbi:MAG: hypothetical protein LBG06_07110 [Deltaproteobacteria bacterium]|jgi:hypothetical protein|nr:hypothetical protein [Deltaproteobacteria bacterium]
MILGKGYRYKTSKPDRESLNLMGRFAGCRRFVCNEGVAVLRRCLDDKGKLPAGNRLINTIPALKGRPGPGFLRQAPSRALRQAMIGLDRALRNRREGRGGHPVFRRKGRGDPFRYPEPGRTVLDGARPRIRLPRPGCLKCLNSRPVAGALRDVTVPIETGGSLVSIETEGDVPDPGPPRVDAIGLDMGIAFYTAGSDGASPGLPPGAPAGMDRSAPRKEEACPEGRGREVPVCGKEGRKAHAGRKGRHRIPVGGRLRRLCRRTAVACRRISDIRKDFHHKAPAAIGKSHAFVAARSGLDRAFPRWAGARSR